MRDYDVRENQQVSTSSDVEATCPTDTITAAKPVVDEEVVSGVESGAAAETIEVVVDSPEKPPPPPPQLVSSPSCHPQCRICLDEKEEHLIDLGCQCRGGLAKAHHLCIIKWFSTRGSNKCEICQQVAANVAPPDYQTNYWMWRVDPSLRAGAERRRVCFNPLGVAFSILVAGLLLDVLISITVGVSALPVNIIIGVIVVLGLGTALRLAMEFCLEWNVRRLVHRAEANVNIGYHPAL